MSKIGTFFKSLLSEDGGVSSKRFAGLILIGLFVTGGIVSLITGDITSGLVLLYL